MNKDCIRCNYHYFFIGLDKVRKNVSKRVALILQKSY